MISIVYGIALACLAAAAQAAVADYGPAYGRPPAHPQTSCPAAGTVTTTLDRTITNLATVTASVNVTITSSITATITTSAMVTDIRTTVSTATITDILTAVSTRTVPTTIASTTTVTVQTPQSSPNAYGCQGGSIRASNGQRVVEACYADYPGNDLRVVLTTTYNACIDQCTQTSGCKGIIWNHTNNRCFLKSVMAGYYYQPVSDAALLLP